MRKISMALGLILAAGSFYIFVYAFLEWFSCDNSCGRDAARVWGAFFFMFPCWALATLIGYYLEEMRNERN